VAGFFDQCPQRPSIPQQIVHPLSQPFAILRIVQRAPANLQPLHACQESIIGTNGNGDFVVMVEVPGRPMAPVSAFISAKGIALAVGPQADLLGF
jgi:hypothetical protein